jgi:hypothetical protein
MLYNRRVSGYPEDEEFPFLLQAIPSLQVKAAVMALDDVDTQIVALCVGRESLLRLTSNPIKVLGLF